MRRQAAVVALLFLISISSACTSGKETLPSEASTGGPLAKPSGLPEPSPRPSITLSKGRPSRHDLKTVRLSLVKVAPIRHAVAMAVLPGSDDLYVAQRTGRVLVVRGGLVRRQPILDISADVSVEGELGVLGLAFSPAGDHLYLSYADKAKHVKVLEYAVQGEEIQQTPGRTVIQVRQETLRHAGGNLVLGPDGYLWLALGDGSLGDDPLDKSQSLRSLRGKLLRLDPSPTGKEAYGTPDDNPFLGKDGARPEIYALGLRNPWRFSFDRGTGDIWIGDVGQNIVEEIDFLPSARLAGANFGWNRLEGSRAFSGSPPPNAVAPIAEYNHDSGGCAVIGGYVYRGAAIEELQGAYLYGDFCDGGIRALIEKRDSVVYEQDLGLRVQSLVSFGEDASGELYVLSLTEGVLRIEKG